MFGKKSGVADCAEQVAAADSDMADILSPRNTPFSSLHEESHDKTLLQDDNSDAPTCPVCLTASPRGALEPCLHAICPPCAASLRQLACPVCRAEAVAVITLSSAVRHSLASLLHARLVRESAVRSAVPVHVILGPPKVGKSDLALALKKLHPLSGIESDEIVQEALIGKDVCTFDERVILDDILGLTWNAPNIRVDGVGVHLRVVSLNEEAVADAVREIADLRPDFLMMVSSVIRLSTFCQMLDWDKRLRTAAVSGELIPLGIAGDLEEEGDAQRLWQLPSRFWVFTFPRVTVGSSFDWRSVDMRKDLGDALEVLPLDQRPATTFTVKPATTYPAKHGENVAFTDEGILRKLARRALFYSNKRRPVNQSPNRAPTSPNDRRHSAGRKATQYLLNAGRKSRYYLTKVVAGL